MLKAILKEIICPDKCMICSKILESPIESLTCNRCKVQLLERDICSRCGKPYAFHEPICIYCNEEPLRLSRVKALFPYRDLYKESVQRWKYTGIRKYAKGYSELMIESWMEELRREVDVLIPIPISKKRYRQRGFNQALDLAHELSHKTGIPVYDILERCKETKPQSACKKEERAANIKGAISVKEAVPFGEGLTIAFIDDIYTTGSTVRECMSVLEKAAVQINKVYILTVCLAL
ncbi:MAG: ComF family protein [Candidatus Niameybacter stercoravium]|nr:ComF family protein [Candidatus Niameybacter stercoravium]